MPALNGRRVRTMQPPPGLASDIDWTNPITRDMTVCLVNSDAAYGFYTYVDGTGATATASMVPYASANVTQSNTPLGTGGRIAAGTGAMYDLVSKGAINSPSYSLFAVASCTSTTNIQSAFDMDNSSGRYFQFRIDNCKVDLIPFNSSKGNTGRATSPVAMTLAEMSRGFTMGGVVSPTRTAAFQNGVLIPGVALTGTPVTPGVDIALRVGSRQTGTQLWNTGGLMLVVAWTRALTDAEMISLADNPWQLFAARRRRMWMSPAAFAAYVLRASTASFVASASEAVLSASRRLVAAAGALTSAWMPAGLIASRRLPVASGAFTVIGTSAAIAAARRIAANVGTFGLAGTDTPITVARRVAAQPGVFTLSPGAVQMTYTPAAGPGGPTYTLTAGLGAFAVTGGAADVLARRRLSATTAALGWLGAVASLLARRKMPTSTGLLSVAGGDVTIHVTRCVLAQSGTFSLSGADAQLRYSAQVTYARAPAGGGYVPQQHYNESRPAATHAVRPAALQRNHR